jgi:uncharacterized membrane protein YdjX (TVP38/TMEM64 family)
MSKKIKIFLGIIYLSIIFITILFFLRYDLKNFLNPIYFFKNLNEFSSIIDQNIAIVIILFSLLFIIWIFCLGIITPFVIFAGLTFEPLIAYFITIFSITLGSTILYLFSRLYFYDLVKKYLEKKYIKYIDKISKNKLFYYFLLRLIPGIPFPIKNILPVIINLKTKIFILATILGETPALVVNILIFNQVSSQFKSSDDFNLNSFFSKEFFITLTLVFIIVLFIKKVSKKYNILS